jgi:hypothetical protein
MEGTRNFASEETNTWASILVACDHACDYVKKCIINDGGHC